jgi:adenine-specific DNA methylase
MNPRKKLIEVALPLDVINAASAREKSIRHGHTSTLHLWWARRPLAAARAVIFAQMVELLERDEHRVHYLRRPFQREPDFGVTSVNYDFGEQIQRAGEPS